MSQALLRITDQVGTRAAVSISRAMAGYRKRAVDLASGGCAAVDEADGFRTFRTQCLGMRNVRQQGTNMHKVRRVTLLELVEAVQDTARSDEEVVAVLTHLLKTVRTVRALPVAA
jgi:hypothetical protein